MTVLASFGPNDANGFHPVALVQATDGNFYGANYYGGPVPYYGTIFKVTPGGALSTVFSFNGTNGRQPSAVLQGFDGNLYGATRDGGSDGYSSSGIATAWPCISNITGWGNGCRQRKLH